MRPRSVPVLLTLFLLATACSAADVVLTPAAGGEVVGIGAGAKAKDYVRVDASGATFRLDGAGELSGWVRAHYGVDERAQDADSGRTAGGASRARLQGTVEDRFHQRA